MLYGPGLYGYAVGYAIGLIALGVGGTVSAAAILKGKKGASRVLQWVNWSLVLMLIAYWWFWTWTPSPPMLDRPLADNVFSTLVLIVLGSPFVFMAAKLST